jgi:hypothetical protein
MDFSLKSIVSGLVEPVTGLISEAIEDKDKAKEIAFKVQKLVDGASARADEYETNLVNQRSAVIQAEAQGSWLQKNWRPLMMLWFAGLIGMWWFGIQPEGMTQEDKNNLFDLLQLGIGGYIVGRSAEKAAPKIVEAFKGGK